MSSELIRKALDVVDEAVELAKEDRLVLIESRCGSDAALRDKVQQLLRFDCGVSVVVPRDHQVEVELPVDSRSHTRYVLGDEIARGGMGIVIAARDLDLDRDVAIKVLLDKQRDRHDALRRFVTEARIGARLQHPGIAPIYDLGLLGPQKPFIAMQLVQGETLAALLSNRTSVDDHLARFLSIFEHVCQTMAYAHSLNIIHRDLKPANVMVGQFGEVQLMDWGLAKILPNCESDADVEPCEFREAFDSGNQQGLTTADSDSTPDTRIGLVMGTPEYMPPEQAAGLYANTTDVFSLGSILCEILTGTPAYSAPTPAEVYVQSVRGETREAFERLIRCDCDEQLADVARKCLAASPADRYADAGEIADEIADYREASAIRLHEAELETLRVQTIAQEDRKRRRIAMALAVSTLLLGVSAMGGWGWVMANTARHAAAIAKTEHTAVVHAEAMAYRNAITAAFLEVETQRYDRAVSLLDEAPERLRDWEWHYLRNSLEQSLRVFDADVDDVEFLTLIPETDHIRFLDSDGTSRLINRWTGEELSRVSIGSGRPLALEPDGDLALTQSDQPVLWDVSTGKVKQRFELGRDASASTAAIAHHGTHVAIRTNNQKLKLFDADSGGLLQEFPNCQCYAPFGRGGDLLVWVDEHAIHFWNVDAGHEIRNSIQVGIGVEGIALSPDASTVAFWYSDHVHIKNLATNDDLKLQSTAKVAQIAFNNDGSRLALILVNGAIQLWDSATGKHVVDLRAPIDIAVWNSAISFEDPLVCTMLGEPSLDKPGHPEFFRREVRLWHTKGETVRILQGHDSYVYPVVVSPDGKRIASGSWDGTVRLWDVETGAEIVVLRPNRGTIYSLSFDKKGNRLAAGSGSSDVLVGNAMTYELIGQARLADKCYSVAFTQDDSRLIVAHGGLSVLDGTSLTPQTTLVPQHRPGDVDHVTEVVPSPTGDSFATFSGKSSWAPENEVLIWDANALTKQARIHAPHLVSSGGYAPDGSRLALGHANGIVTIWRLDDLEKPSVQIKAHLNEVLALQFLSNSRLATGGKDGKMLIWDCETGEQLGILAGHGDYVYSLALDPSGQRLVSGSGDATVRIWETFPLARRLDAIHEAASWPRN